jgi:hypothetical protein
MPLVDDLRADISLLPARGIARKFDEEAFAACNIGCNTDQVPLAIVVSVVTFVPAHAVHLLLVTRIRQCTSASTHEPARSSS